MMLFIFLLSDDGAVQFVGLHYSINKFVSGVSAGDYNYDVTNKIGILRFIL